MALINLIKKTTHYMAHLFDNKKDRHYVSPTDKMFKKFNEKHPERTESQILEIDKHKNIFKK